MKLIKKQKVGASITDSLANLSVIGIFQTVEDAVTELMGELKLDNITMKEADNAIWVFAKNRIKILRNIAWNENFYTVCFISSITRATVYVDIAIKNQSEELCAYSRVELCALDLQTERIKRISTTGIADRIIPENSETDIAFTRFDKAELPEYGQVQVKYTNIDFSRHTNNIEYIRFMLNTYSVRELEARPVKEMEIIYTNQSFEDDVLTIRRGSLEGKDVFLLQKEDKVVARSEVVFENEKTGQGI
ncbi:MAG: hypothetical protein K2N94_13600 [Lachnospiraceae bacterium]|nr:hypothetical protein [Lachnospiraceae bacterium]